MNIEKQISVASYQLNKLRTLDIHAVLAGGACRDWKLGLVANDLDFFVYYNPEYTINELKRSLERVVNLDVKEVGRSINDQETWLKFGHEMLRWAEQAGTNYTSNPLIHCVFEYEVDTIKCQVIFLKKCIKYVSLVNTFPFNICQAYWCGNDIYGTYKFDQGIKHRVIEITGEFYSNGDQYVKKIRDRFKDFMFIEK